MAPLQFGILMIPYQTIDVAGPLDILSSCSQLLVAPMEAAGFDPGYAGLTAKAIDITFHHISTTLEPVSLTAGFKAVPSTTVDACPPLDHLLVGGPDPFTFKLDERFATFVKKHVAEGKGLFTTCSGAWAIASTGVLDGKNATVNHEMIGLAEQMYPNVKWTKEKNWVVDGEGKIWTAGGACAGMDMLGEWVVQNYGVEVASMGFKALDFDRRDVRGERLVKG